MRFEMQILLRGQGPREVDKKLFLQCIFLVISDLPIPSYRGTRIHKLHCADVRPTECMHSDLPSATNIGTNGD